MAAASAGETRDGAAAKPDWEAYVSQLLACGLSLRDIGELTFTQANLHLDGFMWRVYWQAMPMVRYASSKYSDEDIQKSRGGAPNPARQKFLDQMMEPYKPSFLRRQEAEVQAQPIPGLLPWTAEGVMQAIEDKRINDEMWREIFPIWDRIYVTSKLERPAPLPGGNDPPPAAH